ncbi:MAG: hypothetical protein EP343_18215 [Deltaproteobacteria bacterium]|nr:MAG: hypothetical protein EP343_18215 [Deltaproteobacteria bacterium]
MSKHLKYSSFKATVHDRPSKAEPDEAAKEEVAPIGAAYSLVSLDDSEPETPAWMEPSEPSEPPEKKVSEEGDVVELYPGDVEPWNPTAHAFRGDILYYEPGKRLVYEHRYDLSNVVWRFVGALVLGWLAGLFLKQVQLSVGIALSVIGVFELVRWKTGRYDTTRLEWDWREGELHETLGEETLIYEMNEIDEVVLRMTRTEHRWSSALSGSRKQNRFYSFNAHVLVSGPDNETFSVASTGELQRHPDEVQYHGLCFAFMLAHQLGVPLRVQELPEPA